MNYIKQINAFWEMQTFNPLTANETYLYFTILNFANKCGWQERIYIPCSAVLAAGGISCRQSLTRLRARLVEKGYITYTPSAKRMQCGAYTIVRLYDDKGFMRSDLIRRSSDELCAAPQEAARDKSQEVSQEAAQDKSDNATIYKIEENKIKENKTSTYVSDKKQYKTFVFLSDDEYAELSGKYGGDLDGILDTLNNYKGSSGKQYASDYYAVEGWAAKRYFSNAAVNGAASRAAPSSCGMADDWLYTADADELSRMDELLKKRYNTYA